jgi:hypothetical protein
MAEVRNVKWVVTQAMREMGLPAPAAVVTSPDATVQQMVALLNRAGNDLTIGFPWEQLIREWILETQDGVPAYDMPADWNYFLDQTQWDRTNHWPLLGPKTAQEWQWLKGGLLSSGPRLRYRVVSGKFELWPVPSPTNTPIGNSASDGVFVPWTLAMEYVSDTWLKDSEVENTYYAECKSDNDIVLLDPWVLTAYLKLKYWEAKGLDTGAYQSDFLQTWNNRIGKNKGAPMLTLAPRARTMLIGINNIPDGSWNVGNGNST